MPDYKQGKIYCLRSHQTDDIYIGSTTQPLSKRMTSHRRDYKCWKHGKCDYVSSFELIKHDDCYIELLEECPCENRNQLLRREGQLIREMDCVNRCIAGRSRKEYREEHKEQIRKQNKKYYENNKEQIRKQTKKYREENKEQIRKQNKKYQEENKEQVAEQMKKYREEHKNDFKCDVCNYSGCKSGYNRHLKSQKHIKNSS